MHVNARSCSLRVLSNVPLHSFLVSSSSFPSSSSSSSTSVTLFFFLLSSLFAFFSLDSSFLSFSFFPSLFSFSPPLFSIFLHFIRRFYSRFASFSHFNNGRLIVVLLTRDIRIRRINARAMPYQRVAHFSFQSRSPSLSRSLTLYLSLYLFRNHARCSLLPALVNFYRNYYNYYRELVLLPTQPSLSQTPRNNEGNKRQQKWRAIREMTSN